ncbi:Phage protein D [Pantoea agglomerans]|uniref:Phage protein D n=1 Tax=Enterobacter agglomerans TaxID=549 RepID=A0A379ABK3_ENTAG|nr:Phage protein D [Pantoea agglomerans]
MMAGSWINGQANAPAFRLTLAGADVTQKIEQRLISLTLTDNRGFEADQLDIELDDADGQLMMPRRGVELSLALGWKGEAFFPKGTYTVDEIEHSGTAARRTG